MPQYYLTDRDREILSEIYEFVRRNRTKGRNNLNPDPDDINSAPDVYVIKTPSTGIGAIYEPTGTGSSPEASYASCQIYTLAYNPDTRKTYVVAIPGLTAYVYNLGETAAEGDKWCLVNRIKQGYWVLTESSNGGGGGGLPLNYINLYLTSNYSISARNTWEEVGASGGWSGDAAYLQFPSTGIWQVDFNVDFGGFWLGTAVAGYMRLRAKTASSSVCTLLVPDMGSGSSNVADTYGGEVHHPSNNSIYSGRNLSMIVQIDTANSQALKLEAYYECASAGGSAVVVGSRTWMRGIKIG